MPHVVLPAAVLAHERVPGPPRTWEEFSVAAIPEPEPPAPADPEPVAAGAAAGAAAAAADNGYPLHPVDRAKSDLAVLLFTSGTAGDPKAAMLSHGNLTANLHQMLGIPEILRADDVGLVALPLFHVFGLNVALGLSLATGAALVLDARFDAAQSLRQVQELGRDDVARRSHHVRGVGRRPRDRRGRHARRSPGSVGRSRARPHSTPMSLFASTVATASRSGRDTASPKRHRRCRRHSARGETVRARSVGPLPGVEVQLVDDEGEPVLEGDTGEIWVRGDNVFAGYWRDATATTSVRTHDGWLRTGDIGVIGDDGDLFVVERSKDLVIVSGFNVFPAEVERVVSSVPGVAEVAVIGRPDRDHG